ncbi:hypothetical protein QVD17_02803 [Tagetes erecta]|uniref:Uncharacterized protein n=1 Tax=Tagetes erecta TaxID=13708 RepID=A0AAD8LCB7_TARER|nr:hypothetical protein QVD17_02803 [Tagetes erecta]
MRNYYHILKFGRSKGHSISNKKWCHQSGSTRSQHLLPHPQKPSPPPPSHESIFSTSLIYENLKNIRDGTISQHGRHQHHARRLLTLNNLKFSDHEVLREPPDYLVLIKGRDVICASRSPKIEYWLPQSNLDLLLPQLDAGVFFCYKNMEDMTPEAVVNIIKNSLGVTLSTFYPLAGEIVPNSQGEPEVLCNNKGVEFVHAHADVEFKTIDLHHPDETVKGKLVPNVNCGVLSVQVTEFKCGTIIVSCAFDHRIVDAASINMFLVAWAEFARLRKISNVPSFRPSILNPRRPPHYNTIYDSLYVPVSSLPPPSLEEKLHSRIYYIRAKSINQLQSEASTTKETKRSKFQSFTAFVWKLIAQENPNATSRMGVVVSGREFLLPNHFGNILSVPYGMMSNQHLQEMPLTQVANKVHEFVSEVRTEEHFRGLIDWVELHRPEPAVARVYFKLKENDGEAVVVSSGQSLPINNDMNFGWGKPYLGSYHFPWGGQTGYITTMPSATKDGDWIVYAHLKQKHLDLIESKARHVFNPVTHSYLAFR